MFVFCSISSGQDRSNRGKEFWLGYGFHWIMANPDGVIALNSQDMALYISTEQAAVVTVSINGTSWSQTLNIPANTVDASIVVPKSGVNDARILTDGLSTRGIRIVSNVPVAVYAHVYVTQGSGATMLMPVETYGFSYYSVNFTQNTSASPLPNFASNIANGPDWYSWFYVVASEDNTRIQITPADSTKNGWLPGQTYTVNLNKGEIYSVFGKMVPNNNNRWAASKDMTGSKVLSVPGADGVCHPIAMFSGSSGIRICRGDGGEYMQQQMFPSQAWGTRYLTFRTINNTNTDINETNRNYYRVCVSDPTTIVKRNGVPLSGLQRNFYYEYMDSVGGDYIEADKPILISQYMVNDNQCWNFPTTSPSPPSNGDPEMFYLSPIEQGQKSVRFFSSRQSPAVTYVYANIIFPTAAAASLRVDGNPVPGTQVIPHPNNPLYSVAVVRFIGVAAQRTITCDSAINATVYGLGNYESYGYNVGTLINNLNYYTAIQNTQSTSGTTDSFSCPKTPLRIFLKVGYPATSIHWKLSQVTGITPNADSIISNPVPIRNETINGRTYWVYTLQQDFSFAQPGTYTIPVTYGAAVIENCSQTESAQVQVVIRPGPTADFTTSSSGNGCVNDNITFNGVVTASGFNITQYLWNFPDNTTASTINTTRTFNTTGAIPIRFRIYADNGCAADTTKNITIQTAATSNFGVAANACERAPIIITDSSTAASGTISTWSWDLGVNNWVSYTNANPITISFSSPGTYVISHVTTASTGCKSDTTRKTIVVHPRPDPSFSVPNMGSVCANDSAQFVPMNNTGVAVASYQWDFGDGQSLVRTNDLPFYHTYSTAGTFPVRMVPVTSAGCTDTGHFSLTIRPRPVASFTISGRRCVDSTLTLQSSVTTSPTTWYWDLGNGQTSSSTTSGNLQINYAAVQSNLRIRHVVNISQTCSSDTAVMVIGNIRANPVVNLGVSPGRICVNDTIRFNATSSTTPVTWQWNVNNNNISAQDSALLTFNSAGTQTIRVRAVDTAGCGSATDQETISIIASPSVNAGPDKIIRPGDTTILAATLANAPAYNIAWTPAVRLSANNVLQPSAFPSADQLYTITATDPVNGCSAYDQVLIRVIPVFQLTNAFSPNGDGINDRWRIQGIENYPGARVAIFTRWGQKIFESKNYANEPWRGEYHGKPAPTGVYYYIIELKNNQAEVLSGAVTLLR